MHAVSSTTNEEVRVLRKTFKVYLLSRGKMRSSFRDPGGALWREGETRLHKCPQGVLFQKDRVKKSLGREKERTTKRREEREGSSTIQKRTQHGECKGEFPVYQC